MYWLELFRSRRGIRDGCTGGAGRLHESNVVHLRSLRYRCYSARIQEDGLGGRARGGHRQAAKYVEGADALSYVAGYCVINDLSERAFQLEGTGQWLKGKSADTFGPIGAMAGHSRRGSGPAESGNVAGGRWSPLSKRIH